MPTLYMLCGVPGAGKSTWTNHYISVSSKPRRDVTILSTDDILENIAAEHGMTYSELFDDISYSFAEKMMHKIAKFAFSQGNDVIWDQTNLSAKSRKKKLDMVPIGYYKIGVYFTVPKDLQTRLDSRPGKKIPEFIIERMIKTLECPVVGEGFDEVVNVNQLIDFTSTTSRL